MDEKVVTIEKIVFGGKGLTRDLDKVTFVPFTLPGEKVRIRITRDRGDYQEAEAIEIVEPSPARITPHCRYFGICGGCQMSHATYEEQVRIKTEILRETLTRNQIKVPPVEVLTGEPFAYRHRAQFKYNPSNRKLGFYELHSNRVVDVQECLCLTPGLNAELKAIRGKVCARSIPNLREVECFENERQQTAIFARPEVLELMPPERQELFISFREHRYPMNPGIFLQVNPGLWRSMIQEVESHYAGTRSGTLLELYCGAGFFTAPLAAKFEKIIACEENADAIAFAKSHHGLKNVEWVCSRVENFRFPQDLDAILVDPPRAGLQQKVIQKILEKRPQMISYVSCDCTTFARDVKKLLATHVLHKITLLDLFPQTYHFEIVAQMKRK